MNANKLCKKLQDESVRLLIRADRCLELADKTAKIYARRELDQVTRTWAKINRRIHYES